jgi:hypothetical protein
LSSLLGGLLRSDGLLSFLISSRYGLLGLGLGEFLWLLLCNLSFVLDIVVGSGIDVSETADVSAGGRKRSLDSEPEISARRASQLRHPSRRNPGHRLQPTRQVNLTTETDLVPLLQTTLHCYLVMPLESEDSTGEARNGAVSGGKWAESNNQQSETLKGQALEEKYRDMLMIRLAEAQRRMDQFNLKLNDILSSQNITQLLALGN